MYLVRSRTTHVLARERNIFVGYAFLNIEAAAVKESLLSPESLYRQMHVLRI